MSEVTLRIGGRSYNVACQDGEEAHILHLGSMIDAKLEAMGDNLSPQDSQNLLFAALFLADEVHEARAKAEKNEATLFEASEVEGLQRKLSEIEAERDSLRARVSELGEQPTEDFAELLENVADSLEKCAGNLEADAAAS